ncbi:MAG: hypothetical protein KDE09_13270 [Anaerolineales bacterium]|nr:hypothetical protein [Anaerolineales bacterium]
MDAQPSYPDTNTPKRTPFWRRPFQPPRVPASLLWATALLIMSMALVVLIRQPGSFWHDPMMGSVGAPWLDVILQRSPILFVGVCAGYTLAICLAMRLLTFRLGIVVWAAVTFYHLQDLWLWTRCEVWWPFGDLDFYCLYIDIVRTLLYAGFVGLVMSAALRPATSGKVVTQRSRLLLPAGILGTVWFLALFFILGRQLLAPAVGWLPVQVDVAPPPRASAAIAYDTNRNVAVLFGGGLRFLGGAFYNWDSLADTWEWDGQAWHQMTPTVKPAPRVSHQMAFDPIRNVTVLFGGQSDGIALADTWEWDGTEWREIVAQAGPAARCCHVMWFDQERERILLAGGLYTPNSFFQDVWEWDGRNWYPSLFIQDSYIPPISGYPSAYDTVNEFAMVYIGQEAWLWQGHQWLRRNYSEDLPPRTDSGLAYDPNQGRFLLYGGCPGGNSGCRYDDTWAYDRDGWVELNVPNTPGGLARHNMFYDAVRQRVMIFAGSGYSGTENRLWEFHWPGEE